MNAKVLLATGATAVGLLIIALCVRQALTDQEAARPRAPAMSATRAPAQPLPVRPAPDRAGATASNAATAAPGEPGIFAGFAHWDARHRTAAVAAVMGRQDLDLDVVAFLDRELDDRDLDETSRNDVANALIAQDRHDPALAARLLAMADATAESPAWRDYALQHAARALLFSDHPREVLARLLAIAQPAAEGADAAPPAAADQRAGPVEPAGSTLRATALLQLDALDREAHFLGTGACVDAAIAALLADPVAQPVERCAAIGLIGARGLRAQAPQVRALLDASSEPGQLRVCLAALGAVGDASDAPLLRRYSAHRHPLVALAARVALDRLQAQPARRG